MLINNHSGKQFEVGCDEAGRGCLAGPVFAAAVILPDDFYHKKLNDSKKISENDRNLLKNIIKENAVSFSVTQVDHLTIDKINILNASILAMHKALELLDKTPDFIIVDGNRFKPFKNIPFECMIKGDGRFASIAAASILAKTYRDEFMNKIDFEFPVYNWKKNKGYPTKEHRDAIRKYGLSPYHRLSFQQLNNQQELGF